MSERLFLYGTLHPDRAPAEIAPVARRLTPIGPGTIRGKRYDLGAYPGVVQDDSGESTVAGEVFVVPDAETLAKLDAYEEFHPEAPEASLYLRVKTPVTFRDGSTESCWVYVYNREIE